MRRVTKCASWLLVVAAMALMAACGSSDSESEAGTDTLVVAEPATPSTLDPDFSDTDESWAVLQNAYGSLTDLETVAVSDGVSQVDLEKGPVGGLAESWEVSDDGKTYTFKLRPDAKSRSGRAITSKDIAWSWDRALAVEGSGGFVLSITSVDTDDPVEIVDDSTFRVNLTAPNPLLPIVLAVPMPFAPIIDSTEAKKHTTDDDPWARKWLRTHTAGYGPYYADSYEPGNSVTWKANPNYYGDTNVKTLIFREVPEQSTRLSLLRSGAVDIATYLDARARESAAEGEGVKVLGIQGNIGMIVGLNTEKPPFDDARVRQAVAYSIPTEEIIDTVYLGSEFASNFEGVVPTSYPFAADQDFAHWPYTHDLAKAKKLVSAAGATGTDVTMTINASRPDNEQAAILIRDALAQVGLNATIEELTPARYQEQYQTREAQMVLVNDAPWVPDAAYSLANYFDPGPSGVANWVNYDNPEATKLMRRALAEPDPKARVELAGRANRIIVDDAPWPAYIGFGTELAMRENIGGYVWRTNNLLDWRHLTKE